MPSQLLALNLRLADVHFQTFGILQVSWYTGQKGENTLGIIYGETIHAITKKGILVICV